jgi:hypothetical protein
MKTKIGLATLIIAFCGLSVSSQTLTNTTWKVYDDAGLFSIYFHFSTNKLSYSTDNTSYTIQSTFQVNGNNFSLVDIAGSTCQGDTGYYTFLIKNDTLKFTLVNDVCPTRPTVFCTYHWVNVPTGIQSENLLPALKLYPNPAIDELLIKSDNKMQDAVYFITDQSGRRMLTGKLTGVTTSVDIRQLSKGLYFLKIEGKSNLTLKVIKQ